MLPFSENDGLTILNMDKNHISILNIFIDKNDFETFEFTEKKIIDISLESFCKVLSMSEKIDKIEINLKNKDSSKLNIIFQNNSRKSKIGLNLLYTDYQGTQVPVHFSNCTFSDEVLNML